MSNLNDLLCDTWFHTRVVAAPADLEAVYALRYQIYCEERAYLPAGNYPDRLETDRYDEHSVQFAAFDSAGGIAAAARLVLPRAQAGLPYQQHCATFAEFDQATPDCAAEVSRLVLNRGYRQPPGGGHLGTVVLGIYREMYRYSHANGISHWYAAMERSLQRLLYRYGFCFTPIGPQVDYFGPVAPYSADVAALLRGLGQRRPALHAWFTSGW